MHAKLLASVLDHHIFRHGKLTNARVAKTGAFDRNRSPKGFFGEMSSAGEQRGRNFEAETPFQVSNDELLGRRCR